HQQQLIAAILLLLMLVVMAISIGVPLCLQRRRAGRSSGGGGAASVPGSSPQATGGGNQKRSEWIYSVLAFTALLVLAASHNATVMLLGSAISLVMRPSSCRCCIAAPLRPQLRQPASVR